MEIRPDVLEKILSENDDQLWQLICRIGAMNNMDLSSVAPSREEMSHLRSVLKNGALNYEDAMKVLDKFKRGAKE